MKKMCGQCGEDFNGTLHNSKCYTCRCANDDAVRPVLSSGSHVQYAHGILPSRVEPDSCDYLDDVMGAVAIAVGLSPGPDDYSGSGGGFGGGGAGGSW